MMFTLYWSNLTLIENCPQAFLWGKGWGMLDVGGGPGRRKPKTKKTSEHHPLLGIVIQAAIERFYNDELWKTIPPERLEGTLLELARRSFTQELSRKFIDWRESPDRASLWRIVEDGVKGYLRTMKAHRFLSEDSRAEVEFLGSIKGLAVGGRADMVISREDSGVTILDGKNSARKWGPDGPYTLTDPDQLRWYAMLYYLKYHRLPDRLGFVYYRYPYGNAVLDKHGAPTGEKETGVSWVPCTKDDIQGLAQRAVDAFKVLQAEAFEPQPSPKGCMYCDYADQCPARQAQKDANKAKRASPTTSGAGRGSAKLRDRVELTEGFLSLE